MNLADPGTARDAYTDLRRLLDAGYEVRITRAPAFSDCSADAPEYLATITSGTGSAWRGFGLSPAEAVRSVWPLGYGPGQGGCGHCNGMGCTVPGCPTCAAYTTEAGTASGCAVCGCTDPDAIDDDEADDDADRLEPYCATCGLPIGIFHGHGPGWHHFRGNGTAESPNVLYDAGHAPALAWHETAGR